MTGWIVLIVLIIILLVAFFFLFWDAIKNYLEKHYHEQRVYKVLNYYAEEEDQLLLNHLVLYLAGDNQPTLFDHIVFADKYVYVVSVFNKTGGLYGNVEDPNLFLCRSKNKVVKIANPILANEKRVLKLEETVHVQHSDKMFVSVVVYNPSLIVPKGIAKKNQTSCFLPVTELEKTIKTAEKDSVSPISHHKSEELVKMLKHRSEQNKSEMAAQEKNLQNRKR